ncbi:MAG: iron ABC transporter permease [Ruminiclostridium sp.]|nr:iron ABC transporter permease [Ruminiclostridium sp.]
MEQQKENTTADIRFDNTIRFALVTTLLVLLLLAGLFLNISIGSVSISVGNVFRMLSDGIRWYVKNLFSGGKYEGELSGVVRASTQSMILFSIRIPRMLLAAVLGGALSVSGYLLQVFFRNPIAGPFELGISSGAKMVVGITLIFLAGFIGNIGSVTMVLAAFLGSLLITCIVLIFSQKVSNMAMLLVIGIMVGYVCSAVTDFCITFADDHDIVNLTNWSMGSFSGANWNQVKAACAICLPALLAAMLLSKPMGAYALGERYAKSMGVAIKPFRLALILLSSLLSACVTAFAGPISFVGIAVPHISRQLLKSSKPIFMIPTAFLSGAVFCVFCDLLARTVLAPTELKIGTVTAVFGAPVVIGMLVRRNRLSEV